MSRPEKLYEKLDPRRLVQAGEVSGRLPLARFERLGELLASSGGEASFQLEFHRSRGRLTAEGRLEAVLMLRCQRCLKPFAFPVSRTLRLALVAGPEEALRIPETHEPCMMDEGRIVLNELVEDELLLVVPDIPRHEDAGCAMPAAARGMDSGRCESGRPRSDATDNPFSVLESLRGQD